MAEISPQLPSKSTGAVPFWRDIRVLGVLAQLVFVVVVALGASWVINNTQQNLASLGEAQFLCRDGSSSFRCAFDFLSLDAQFDIAESTIAYEPTDSYWRALGVAALNTVKVTILGVVLATILGTLTGIARLSPNWLVSNIAKWYIDIMRNTPLLLQLFFLYFAVLLTLPAIRDAIQPFGLPIYLSQRGINLPAPVFMPSFATWLAFIILGLIQAQVLWIILGHREQESGRESNRFTWAALAFLAVVIIGWFVSSASADNQAILAPRALRVREFRDLPVLVRERLGLEDLSQLDEAVASGRITSEAVDEAALKICAV
jgi:general L-amino acid transport system permease protein